MSTFGRVADIISQQMGVDVEGITHTSNLADLGADSLDVVEIMIEIEEEFDITIPDSDFEQMNNVGDIVAYIEGKINE